MTVNEIIDLTEDDLALTDKHSTIDDKEVVKISVSDNVPKNKGTATGSVNLLVHSLLELPELPITPTYEPQVTLPRPQLGICKATGTNSLTLAWLITPGTHANNGEGEEKTVPLKIVKYELWTYIDSYENWRQIAEIGALPPPMSCTLTQIKSDVVNFFSIRAVDAEGHLGPFSLPCNFTQQSSPLP